MVVDSRLCGGENSGVRSCGGCFLAIGCKQGGAENQAQEGDCRLPIADCRLPIADCRLPIADCRLPIADCRLPIADCRLPIADCRLPIADCRLPIADCRLPIADCRLPILRQQRLRSSWSGWFVSCLFLLYYANDLCHRQKPLYPQKPEYQVFL